MPRRKNYHNNHLKFSERRLQIEDLPLKTMKVTIHALKWVFLLIFLFIIVGICILFLTGGDSYFQLILGYSIAGFFTFFMGYFGWLLAQGMIEMIMGKGTKEQGLAYHFRKLKKYKF